jgi:hypothetical protein
VKVQRAARQCAEQLNRNNLPKIYEQTNGGAEGGDGLKCLLLSYASRFKEIEFSFPRPTCDGCRLQLAASPSGARSGCNDTNNIEVRVGEDRIKGWQRKAATSDQ